MNKPWQLVLILAGIFVAGGVTGTFVTLHFGREWAFRRPGPDYKWAPNHLKHLSDRLNLQPAQEEQIRPIVTRNMEELSKVRNNCITATKAVFDRMQQEISEKLTPEQLVKYEQFNKEMRERAKRVMPERFGHPPGPDGPPPGGPGHAPGDMPPPPGKPSEATH
jgi:Spy/CpxP family protein refolding chaperone